VVPFYLLVGGVRHGGFLIFVLQFCPALSVFLSAGQCDYYVTLCYPPHLSSEPNYYGSPPFLQCNVVSQSANLLLFIVRPAALCIICYMILATGEIVSGVGYQQQS